MSTRTAQPPTCDLLWAGSKPDAHALYAEARARSPVCFDPKQNAWIVLGYEPVLACLKDVERLSNDPVAEFDPFVVGGDPPVHTKYRRILQDSVRHLDKLAVAEFAGAWLDRFFARAISGATFDAVADLAVPLVDELAGHLVGLTPDEVVFFKSLRPENRAHVRSFDQVTQEFFGGIINRESSAQRGGALHAILRNIEGSELSEREAVSLLRLLWIGGTATSNLFNPSALRLLAVYPSVQSQLRENLGLVPAFISEALRLEGPTTTVPRRAKTDFELCGQMIRQNDALKIGLLSANSDPALFPEPHAIDLRRPAGRQLAFGFGIHHCLGGYIAKALAETVVARTLLAGPHLQWAEAADGLDYEDGNLRGLKRLRLFLS